MRHVLAALCSPLALPAAYASPDTCFQRTDLEPIMLERYGEQRVSIALDGRGWLMEVWTNPVNGSWTATITTPDGVACFAASGYEYQAIEIIPGVDG